MTQEENQLTEAIGAIIGVWMLWKLCQGVLWFLGVVLTVVWGLIVLLAKTARLIYQDYQSHKESARARGEL